MPIRTRSARFGELRRRPHSLLLRNHFLPAFADRRLARTNNPMPTTTALHRQIRRSRRVRTTARSGSSTLPPKPKRESCAVSGPRNTWSSVYVSNSSVTPRQENRRRRSSGACVPRPPCELRNVWRLTFGAIFAGHGADVKSVDWHPQKGLLASGSRDPQQPVMLWDPRQPSPISTL